MAEVSPPIAVSTENSRKMLGHTALVRGSILALLLLTGIAMTAWTWGTWPDPIIDFGRELYVPWQLNQGKVLYRDIAYFNGPLSPYINALWFRLFGVSLRTLVICNLLIVGLIAWMIYSLIRDLADRLAATAATLAFLLLFAFQRYEWIGNSNYICPYSHETTHGIALCLAMMVVIRGYMRSGRLLILAGAGFILGLIFLTKVEIFVAAAAAALAAIALDAWRSASLMRLMRSASVLITAVILPPLLAWLGLSLFMPTHEALLGTIGSWQYTFDRRLTNLLYFKIWSGLLDPVDSLTRLTMDSLGIVALLVPLGLAALLAGRRKLSRVGRCWPAAGTGAVVGIILILAWKQLPWLELPRPLPLGMVILGILGFVELRRSRNDPSRLNRAMFFLVVLVLAFVLLLKMILNTRLSNYGYFLAMPATILAIAALVGWLPAWIARHGGDGSVIRTGAAVGLLVTTGWYLGLDHYHFAALTIKVGSGADAFYADHRGQAVNALLDFLRQNSSRNTSLAVLPEGAMINFLARRANSTAYVIFMPSDLIMFGEDRVLNAFQANPPDYIILAHKDTSEYGYRFFGQDGYAVSLKTWIDSNYQFRGLIGHEPFRTEQFGILVLERKPTPPPVMHLTH